MLMRCRTTPTIAAKRLAARRRVRWTNRAAALGPCLAAAAWRHLDRRAAAQQASSPDFRRWVLRCFHRRLPAPAEVRLRRQLRYRDGVRRPAGLRELGPGQADGRIADGDDVPYGEPRGP